MEDLQVLWQRANLESLSMDKVYHPDDLIPQIARLEKDQERLLAIKTSVAIGMMLILLITFLNYMEFSWTRVTGIGIFLISILVILILLNRWRFRITQSERSMATSELVSLVEQKIHRERKVFTIFLPIFGVVALTGFNLMYLEYFSDLDAGTRVLYHGILTGSLLIAFMVGLSIRIRRFQQRFHPILDRIRKFRNHLSS
jgi:amino acid transporter